MSKKIDLVNSIKYQSSSIYSIAKMFEAELKKISFDKFNADHWILKITHDSLVKLSHIVEKELNSTETLNILSVSRYICELNIQLNLIKKDSKYSLVYYGGLIKNQREYWTRLKEQLEREVIALNELKIQEDELHEQKLAEILQMPEGPEKVEAARALFPNVNKAIDEKAERVFSIHAEQAKINGYGFQAVLIANKQLPKVLESIKEIDIEEALYNLKAPESVIKIVNSRLTWSDKAKMTNLSDDYHFIYSFSSKLLHALPASISTDELGLSEDETVIFLKFIKVRVIDILRLSQSYLE